MNTIIVLATFLVVWPSVSFAADDTPHRHQAGQPCGTAEIDGAKTSRFEGVQIETSNIASHELLFELVLGARSVFKVDHPQVDHLRGYCYRDVLIVIRQDLKTARPTGWVQVNFVVPDAEAVQRELEEAIRRGLGDRDEPTRATIARLKLKPDVPRSNCRASRLELYGPEGFLIGFDQFKPGTCK
jgi:hypothetical protein